MYTHIQLWGRHNWQHFKIKNFFSSFRSKEKERTKGRIEDLKMFWMEIAQQTMCFVQHVSSAMETSVIVPCFCSIFVEFFVREKKNFLRIFFDSQKKFFSLKKIRKKFSDSKKFFNEKFCLQYENSVESISLNMLVVRQ